MISSLIILALGFAGGYFVRGRPGNSLGERFRNIL